MKNKIFKIVEKFKIFLPISLAIILTGVILICTIGMNVGLDFAGGAQVKVSFGNFLDNNASAKNEVYQVVENTIEENGFEIGQVRWSTDTVEGTSCEIGIEYKYNGKEIDSKNADEQQKFLDLINGENDTDTESLRYKIILKVNEYATQKGYTGFLDLTSDNITSRIVNASTANRLLLNALLATGIAVVAILIYIAFRFTLSSGIAAVLALLHDLLIMISLVTIFRVQVNTTFVAAIITIVGYSINATIVIFDRIKEISKMPSMQDASDTEIANMAISNTMSRSILTSITTLITIVVLSIVCAILGVATMQEFALPIIFGIVAGFYSSVFLSAPTWVLIRKLLPKKSKK